MLIQQLAIDIAEDVGAERWGTWPCFLKLEYTIELVKNDYPTFYAGFTSKLAANMISLTTQLDLRIPK